MKVLLYITIILAAIIFVALTVLYKMQDKLIFYPEELPNDYEFSFNGNYEEVFLKTKDSEINVIHFKNVNPRGAILYFHGNSGSLNTWGMLGEEFLKLGYDFIVFDYRGYGKSKGNRSEKGFFRDADTLYGYVKKFFPENRIIIYGRSLGTGFATRLASRNHPKALILETPYYSFRSVAQHHFPFVPMSLILRWKIRTNRWIRKVKSPILIFHGTNDETIPYTNALKLKKYLKPGDTFVTVPYATHNNIPLFPEYLPNLEKYLNVEREK